MPRPSTLGVLFILLAAGVAASGCLSTDEPSAPAAVPEAAPDASWAAKAIVYGTNPDGTEHDHKNWSQHVGLSTPNFVELGWDPLAIDAMGGKSVGGYFCGGAATTPEGRRLQIISSLDTDVAFVVVDTTDPLHPVHVGDYILDGPAGYGAMKYDVDMTPDGKHVVIGADLPLHRLGGGSELAVPVAGLSFSDLSPAATYAVQPKFRDACTGETRDAGPVETLPLWPGTILVSLADPTNPTFEDFVAAPVLGPHSVSTAIVDGTAYVASSTTNLVHQGSYYQFFEIAELPTQGKLVLLSTVDSAQYGNPLAQNNGHVDAEIAVHPVTKKAVAYLSNWNGGLVLLDFSVPAAPTLLGTWADEGPDGGQVHSTRSLEVAHNGRHYVLAGQEFIAHPVNRPSGWIYILDDTDPTDVKEIGRWTLPVPTQEKWNGVELFSTHYFRVVNDTAFVSMYHGGLWAFQLDFENPENMKEPLSLGVFIPDKWPEKPRGMKEGYSGGMYNYAPFVLDVFPYEDNRLVVFDALSGVYSLEWHPDHAIPSPPPFPASGVSPGGD